MADRGQARQDQGDGRWTREAQAGEDREAQGERAGEGGTSVPGHQAPVRFDEGALPRLGEEYGACDHAVCAVEFVDGATAVVGDDGIVASAAPESAKSGPERRDVGPENTKSVVLLTPKASDMTDEGLFDDLIRPSLTVMSP